MKTIFKKIDDDGFDVNGFGGNGFRVDGSGLGFGVDGFSGNGFCVDGIGGDEFDGNGYGVDGFGGGNGFSKKGFGENGSKLKRFLRKITFFEFRNYFKCIQISTFQLDHWFISVSNLANRYVNDIYQNDQIIHGTIKMKNSKRIIFFQ